jgi:hypothetical protein
VFKKDRIHQSDRTVPRWVQVIAAICGAAMVATGTVAVFITTGNSNGAASLVVAGAVVGLLAMFANNIQTLDVGGLKVGLVEAARKNLVAADEAESEGRDDVADALRDQATVLLSDSIEPIARRYEQIRLDQPRGSVRTAEMDRLLTDEASRIADSFPDVSSMEARYDIGCAGDRAVALNAIRVKPEIASLRVLLDALRNPKSGNEVFLALQATEASLERGRLPEADRSSLRHEVETALHEHSWSTFSDRVRTAAERILEHN